MSFVYTQPKYRHILKRKCGADITSEIPTKKVFFPGDPQTNLILIDKQVSAKYNSLLKNSSI